MYITERSCAATSCSALALAFLSRSISGDVVLAANPSLKLLYQKMVTRQGPRSNFEIEGGGGGGGGDGGVTLRARYWRGTRPPFLTNSL